MSRIYEMVKEEGKEMLVTYIHVWQECKGEGSIIYVWYMHGMVYRKGSIVVVEGKKLPVGVAGEKRKPCL